jgi:hypothetical protein
VLEVLVLNEEFWCKLQGGYGRGGPYFQPLLSWFQEKRTLKGNLLSFSVQVSKPDTPAKFGQVFSVNFLPCCFHHLMVTSFGYILL